MVTLATSSPSSNSLKAPMLLDRQQPFRSSKKFKRQQQQQHQQNCFQQQQQAKSKPKPRPIIALDPVYLEDDEVFYNLMLKERTELKQRQLATNIIKGNQNNNNNNKTTQEKVQKQFITQTKNCKLLDNDDEDAIDSDDKEFIISKSPDIDDLIIAEQDDLAPVVDEPALSGQLRHSLLSWMLNICEHQCCQDEIFPLATMILDKFLLFQPTILPINKFLDRENSTANLTTANNNTTTTIISDKNSKELSPFSYNNNNNNNNNYVCTKSNDYDDDDDAFNGANFMIDEEFYCNEDELNQRQLYLFAACSLLLATKLRQTPRLCVQVLIEFSRKELFVALNRDEILDGELLILATLKWDLAALVTPNDFLLVLLSKCQHLLSPNANISSSTTTTIINNNNSNTNMMMTRKASCPQFTGNSFQTVVVLSKTTTLKEKQQQEKETTTRFDKNDNNNHDHDNDIDKEDNSTSTTNTDKQFNNNESNKKFSTNRCDESRVRRHTQTLLELCLMGK